MRREKRDTCVTVQGSCVERAPVGQERRLLGSCVERAPEVLEEDTV